jgi:hypothetical protein
MRPTPAGRARSRSRRVLGTGELRGETNGSRCAPPSDDVNLVRTVVTADAVHAQRGADLPTHRQAKQPGLHAQLAALP